MADGINSERADCVALINILWLRRRLDRNQAWFLRGCCAHPDSFQQMLAARAKPKDIADAEAIYRDAPPSFREIWQQEGLIAKHLAERLSDEEKEAVFAALRSPKDKVKSAKKSKEPAAPKSTAGNHRRILESRGGHYGRRGCRVRLFVLDAPAARQSGQFAGRRAQSGQSNKVGYG